jgi:hypothetical protein
MKTSACKQHEDAPYWPDYDAMGVEDDTVWTLVRCKKCGRVEAVEEEAPRGR